MSQFQSKTSTANSKHDHEPAVQLDGKVLARWLHRFELKAFREGQEEIIRAVCSGRDVEVHTPTGSGKSLAYQMPAAILHDQGLGTTIVVSPLILLIEDQVRKLQSLGIQAEYLHSQLPIETKKAILDRLSAGVTTLLYIAPERVRSNSLNEALASTKIALLAVDEADCVDICSNFRPSYLFIPRLRKACGDPPIVTTSGISTPKSSETVRSKLELRAPLVFTNKSRRQNLEFQVESLRCTPDIQERCLSILATPNLSNGLNLVFCPRRDECERMCCEAIRRGIQAGFYHAGLTAEKRQMVMDSFRSGKITTVFSTIAFGMGVDIPNIRRVIHLGPPASLEDYENQAGRAGRDGEPAKCILLHEPHRLSTSFGYLLAGNPSESVLRTVFSSLWGIGSSIGHFRGKEFVIPWDEDTFLSMVTNNRRTALRYESAVRILEQFERLYQFGDSLTLTQSFSEYDRNPIDPEMLKTKLHSEVSKFLHMVEYLGTTDPQKYLTQYFETGPLLDPECKDPLSSIGVVDATLKELALFIMKEPTDARQLPAKVAGTKQLPLPEGLSTPIPTEVSSLLSVGATQRSKNKAEALAPFSHLSTDDVRGLIRYGVILGYFDECFSSGVSTLTVTPLGKDRWGIDLEQKPITTFKELLPIIRTDEAKPILSSLLRSWVADTEYRRIRAKSFDMKEIVASLLDEVEVSIFDEKERSVRWLVCQFYGKKQPSKVTATDAKNFMKHLFPGIQL